MRCKRKLLTAMIAVVLVIVASGCGPRMSQEAAPFEKPVSADGDRIELTVVGNPCVEDVSTEVNEGPAEVVITAYLHFQSNGCVDMGVEYDTVVELDRPLGERGLVDGACLTRESPHSACIDHEGGQ